MKYVLILCGESTRIKGFYSYCKEQFTLFDLVSDDGSHNECLMAYVNTSASHEELLGAIIAHGFAQYSVNPVN